MVGASISSIWVGTALSIFASQQMIEGQKVQSKIQGNSFFRKDLFMMDEI